MAPKKDKGPAPPKTSGFDEVQRAFYELELADCNRKLARLRAAVTDYELRNEELQKAYDKLDEDRADIIAYLKRTLNLKNEENNELKEKVKGLEEIREIENAQFKVTVTELERNFRTMKDQLSAENKLLAGKLNTLEEFRAIRDDLMRKYDIQEQAFKDQEMTNKRQLYDVEKKFVIGKDKLKREMEAQLLQLTQDFQDASELRIAASTHRVIRENIAINTELDKILMSQVKLTELNEKYKEYENAANIARQLAEEERDKAINKNVVQLKVISQLTATLQEMKQERALLEKRNFDAETLQARIQKLVKENDNLNLHVRILEQNLHAKQSDDTKTAVKSSRLVKEVEKLKNILRTAANAVQAALKLDQWAMTDQTREIMERKTLLTQLHVIICQYQDTQRADSMETVASFGKVYEKGDLGFVPRYKSVTSPAAYVTDKESLSTRMSSTPKSTSVTSGASLDTVPSVKLMTAASVDDVRPKDSLESFATSTHSTLSESTEDEAMANMSELERQLEQSKLDIQKSIMKDLAFSQISMKSKIKFADDRSSKSGIMVEETSRSSIDTKLEEPVTVEEKEDKEGEDTTEADSEKQESTEEFVDETPKDE